MLYVCEVILEYDAYDVLLKCVLPANIKRLCWTLQVVEWGDVLVYTNDVLQCLHSIAYKARYIQKCRVKRFMLFMTSRNRRLWECRQRRLNFHADTLNDFPTWLSTSKNQKDISVTKSMPFWLKWSQYIIRAWRRQFPVPWTHKFNRTKIFISAFKFRAKFFHINL